MRVARKAKSDHDCDRSSLRRKELLALAGSLSADDARALRSAIKSMRRKWRWFLC